jgi:hypothetical protein
MSTRDAYAALSPIASRLPATLLEPIEGVTFAAYLFVEAARLDGLATAAVLSWLGIRRVHYERAEERWSERVDSELLRESDGDEATASFDALYEEALTLALLVWRRRVEPLDSDVTSWITYQRHVLDALDPQTVAEKVGLTPGDEMRLAHLWRERVALPEIAARAVDAWSGPLLPLPAVTLEPILFPPLEAP